MKYFSSASGKSIYRGYNYYLNKKIITHMKVNEIEYVGKVKGSNEEIYDVHINLNKPKISTCTCEFAKGRNVICKHMIAIFFTVFPQEAENYIKEIEEYQNEYEKQQIERTNIMLKYINGLNKSELKRLLIEILERDEKLKDEFIDYLIY